MTIEEQKRQLREHMRSLRRELSRERRFQAADALIDKIAEVVEAHPLILSYMPYGYEIDVTDINMKLGYAGQLVLPRVNEYPDGSLSLSCFRVEHIYRQLATSYHGIREPIPAFCEEVPAEEISLVLVPGLAFDGTCHRLGSGKGIYDRFLASLPASTLCIGVGYIEQFVDTPLPTESHDWRLDGLILT